jgi:hypothetical protein
MSRVMVISGLDEGFRYVTFDIIRERVIEVKEFGACAVGSFLIYHCAFIIAHLSLNIGDDIYGITSSKSAIRNPKSEIGIAKTMKT